MWGNERGITLLSLKLCALHVFSEESQMSNAKPVEGADPPKAQGTAGGVCTGK